MTPAAAVTVPSSVADTRGVPLGQMPEDVVSAALDRVLPQAPVVGPVTVTIFNSAI